VADFKPAMLGKFDYVEVFDLQHVDFKRGCDWLELAKATRVVRVEGAAAQQIGKLFRALPAGGQMRCHIPPYGLRFYAGAAAICEASICWKCNNIFGQAAGQQVFFEFESTGAASRKLLALCRLAMNDVEAEEPLEE
jgi:hypothetical protein